MFNFPITSCTVLHLVMDRGRVSNQTSLHIYNRQVLHLAYDDLSQKKLHGLTGEYECNSLQKVGENYSLSDRMAITRSELPNTSIFVSPISIFVFACLSIVETTGTNRTSF